MGRVSDGVQRAHDIFKLLHDRSYACSINAFFREELLVSKSNFSQELVDVCQLTVMFLEHRRDVHHLSGDDELGDDVDGDIEPAGKGFEIA